MNCEDVEHKIPLLCGDDLPPEENRERLMEHINQCDSCKRTLQEYRDSREVLHHMKDEGMPKDFWASFQQDLDAKLAEMPSPSRGSASREARDESFTPSTSSLRTALVAAAMLLVGIGLGYFGKPFLPENGSDRRTPTESASSDPSTSSERASDDAVREEDRSIERSPDTRSVRNGHQRNELHEIHQDERILPNPIRDLKPEDQHNVHASD